MTRWYNDCSNSGMETILNFDNRDPVFAHRLHHRGGGRKSDLKPARKRWALGPAPF